MPRLPLQRSGRHRAEWTRSSASKLVGTSPAGWEEGVARRVGSVCQAAAAQHSLARCGVSVRLIGEGRGGEMGHSGPETPHEPALFFPGLVSLKSSPYCPGPSGILQTPPRFGTVYIAQSFNSKLKPPSSELVSCPTLSPPGRLMPAS